MNAKGKKKKEGNEGREHKENFSLHFTSTPPSFRTQSGFLNLHNGRPGVCMVFNIHMHCTMTITRVIVFG